MTTDVVKAQMRQSKTYFAVESYTTLTTDSIDYIKDDYNQRARVRTKEMLSSGINIGAYRAGKPQDAVGCRTGEVRFGERQIGDQVVGYICSLPDPHCCPALGSHPAKEASVISFDPSNPSTRPIIQCEYDIGIFKNPEVVKQWIKHFEDPYRANTNDASIYEFNLRNRELYAMPLFCASTSTNCVQRDVMYNGTTKLDTCARFNAMGSDTLDDAPEVPDDGGAECRQWGNVPYPASGSRDGAKVEAVGRAVETYCNAATAAHGTGLPAPECWCQDRRLDPTFNEMQHALGEENMSYINSIIGCTWLPCTNTYNEQLRAPVDDCNPATDLTICLQILNADDIEGDIDADWLGEMTCGGLYDGPSGGGGGGGGGSPGGPGAVPPKDVDWSDVSAWPWWVWLLIGIGGIAVIGLLFWLLKPSSKPDPYLEAIEMMTFPPTLPDDSAG